MNDLFTEDDIADYAINIDPDVVLQDYDDADELYHITEETKETDIKFE